MMTTPGVGAIVGLTYVSAVDDPGRFKSSKSVGAHFGLTPTKYQSGETDVTGRISKIGDASVRTALYGAYHPDALAQGQRAQELGDEARQARWHEESKGGACAQAGCRPAPHAGRWQQVCGRQSKRRRSRRGLRKGDRILGQETTPAFPKRSPIAGTVDQVRPQDGQWHCDHAYLDWSALSSLRPHQVAAMRRPRTEARPGDWTTWKGIDKSGPRYRTRVGNGCRDHPVRAAPRSHTRHDRR